MFSVPSSLALALRPLLLACLLPLALLPARASDDPVQPATALIGTWVHEKNVGIAKVTIHTTYRDDGTAVELVRVKPIFGHPSTSGPNTAGASPTANSALRPSAPRPTPPTSPPSRRTSSASSSASTPAKCASAARTVSAPTPAPTYHPRRKRKSTNYRARSLLSNGATLTTPPWAISSSDGPVVFPRHRAD